MVQLQRRAGWLFFILLAGAGAFWLGQQWLFRETACPRLQMLLLGGAAIFASLWGLARVAIADNDSPFAQLIRAIIVLALAPLFAWGAGGTIARYMPEWQAVVCPCGQVAQAEELRENGKQDGAEFIARKLFNETRDPACKAASGSKLALIRLEQAQKLAADHHCDDVVKPVTEATDLANRYGTPELRKAVEGVQANVKLLCAPPTPTATPSPTSTPPPTATPVPTGTPTPTPRPLILTVLGKTTTSNTLRADVKVREHGVDVTGLPAASFSLVIDGVPADIRSVTESTSKDQVCVVAAIDRSGSITPGLMQMQDAVRALNQAAGAGDELGMVVFSDRDDVRSVQTPGVGVVLDPAEVRAIGNRTALWDGVNLAIATARQCTSPNKYIILITDGADNHSRLGANQPVSNTIANLVELANASGIRICAIGVRSSQLRPDQLGALAVPSGCDFFPAENFAEISQLIGTIIGNIEHFYRLEVDVAGLQPGSRYARLHVEGTEQSFEFVR